MTPRERVEIALRGGTPDRVPVVPLIDTSYAAACAGVPVSECFLNPDAHARALVHTLERHPDIDGLSINIGLAECVIRRQSEDVDGFTVATHDGVEWRVPRNDIGTPVHREIAGLDDERLFRLDCMRPHIVETLARIPESVLTHYDICAGLTGPFSHVAFMAGVEQVLTAMIEQPAELHRAIQARVPLSIEWAEEMARMNPASIWVGEGVASNSLISPAQYREFVLPYEREVFSRLRQLGVPSVLHICGKASAMLELICESGADCLELDWQVDLAEAKRRIGGRIALKGNLHTTRLVQAGPDQIEREARRALDQAAEGGGFILSSGCALGRDTPAANIDAMVRAAVEFGTTAS